MAFVASKTGWSRAELGAMPASELLHHVNTFTKTLD